MVKQLEPKKVVLGDVTYAIYPFGAMYAANLSGELGKFLGPIVAGAMPLLGIDDDALELDLKEAMPLMTAAFETLDGDRVERLLRKLLTDRKNISCQYRDGATGEVVQAVLDVELADVLFCQNIDDMYRLAVEVVNLNFSGFFKKILGQSGKLKEMLGEMTQEGTEGLTVVDSGNLS